MAISEHNFITRNQQLANIPKVLKATQNHYNNSEHEDNHTFNTKMHADIFKNMGQNGATILSITDQSTKHTTTTTIPDDSTHRIAQNLDKHWFNNFGLPMEIYFKKGKVETSQLSHAIDKLTGDAHNQTPKCNSQSKTYNLEIEVQWMNNKDVIPSKEFVEAINFFHHIKGVGPVIETEAIIQQQPSQPDQNKTIGKKCSHTQNPLLNLAEFEQPGQYRGTNLLKRKDVKLCRHKLQQAAGHNHQNMAISDRHHSHQPENCEQTLDPEWSQLRVVEQWWHQQR
jgi:hypothetical protein